MPPRFVYFDLGNVLLNFDHALACRQMAAVAGISAEQVLQVVFDSGLNLRYERGEIDDRQFYEAFCEQTGTRPDPAELQRAGSDIFSLNVPIMPIVAALDSAGYRLGILSNTGPAHWSWCGRGRYGIIFHPFRIHALSFEIGAVKPDAKIYAAAAKLAGVPPAEIFFTDDIAGHVAGARSAGFDAVQYTGAAALAIELRNRGVEFNY
jgi:putative hydrolase of the HAD superfamily